VGVLAPAGAFADQGDLGLALLHHQALDERRERGDLGPRHLAQRRPLVAEDAGVAVAVRADGAADAHVLQHLPQDPHRVLGARVLRVGLDPLQRGLRTDALDLELGDEHGQLSCSVRGERDRALRREEAEAREVLDVLLVEEHVAGEFAAAHVLEEAFAARLQLVRGDACDRALLQLHESEPTRLVSAT
jgi:hypothetical protein